MSRPGEGAAGTKKQPLKCLLRLESVVGKRTERRQDFCSHEFSPRLTGAAIACPALDPSLPSTVSFFKLRYNSHHINLTILKYTIQRVLVYLEPSLRFSSRTFSLSPKETPYPLTVTLNFPLPQPLATTNLLSVSMNLPVLGISYNWTHSIRGLYVWLLSLSLTFSRFIHVVPCVGASFPFMAK